MQQVHQVEIIISSLKLNEVLKIVDKIGISGYTVIDSTALKGD